MTTPDDLIEIRRLVARAKGSLSKQVQKTRPTHREHAVSDLEAALELLNELIDAEGDGESDQTG